MTVATLNYNTQRRTPILYGKKKKFCFPQAGNTLFCAVPHLFSRFAVLQLSVSVWCLNSVFFGVQILDNSVPTAYAKMPTNSRATYTKIRKKSLSTPTASPICRIITVEKWNTAGFKRKQGAKKKIAFPLSYNKMFWSKYEWKIKGDAGVCCVQAIHAVLARKMSSLKMSSTGLSRNEKRGGFFSKG